MKNCIRNIYILRNFLLRRSILRIKISVKNDSNSSSANNGAMLFFSSTKITVCMTISRLLMSVCMSVYTGGQNSIGMGLLSWSRPGKE